MFQIQSCRGEIQYGSLAFHRNAAEFSSVTPASRYGRGTKPQHNPLMITRFIAAFLLASSLLVLLRPPSAAPTIELIVPSYDYTPGHATSTIAQGIANDGTVVGAYSSNQTPEASYLRLANGRFNRPIVFPRGNFTTAF